MHVRSVSFPVPFCLLPLLPSLLHEQVDTTTTEEHLGQAWKVRFRFSRSLVRNFGDLTHGSTLEWPGHYISNSHSPSGCAIHGCQLHLAPVALGHRVVVFL